MFNKDKLVYRILSGKTQIKIRGETYFIKGANAHQRYLAEELFEELYEEYLGELMSDEELMDWLIENDYWSVDEEEKINKYKKDIEDFQVKLYELGFKGEEKRKTKKMISYAKDKVSQLLNRKHEHDNLSARGVALIEKNKFLIGLGLTNSHGSPLFNEFNYLDNEFPLFDRIIIEYNKKMITIPEFREMARTEPWRQYWSAKEGTTSVFDTPATLLTDDQLSLLSWTRLYDSVYQHPKCPPDEIINDDDALDGFLIKDKRNREAENNKNVAEELISNPKIRNAQEVFIMAETPEDIRRVESLNDDATRAMKRKRDEFIDKKGSVKEAELPDVKKRLQIEINARKFKKG